jgi:cytochrome P450
VVRYGPNRISFNSVDALKTIYSSYGHKAKIVKADYYTVVGHHFGALNLVSIDDPAEHSRKRRIMAQALTTSAVKSMHPSIWKNLASLFDSLRPTKSATWSAPVDMTRLSNAFAFDTMAEIVFGRNLGMLTSHTNRWILSVLPEAVKFLHIVRPVLCLFGLSC